MSRYYKIDKKTHEVFVVEADSEQEAFEKVAEEDFIISEIYGEHCEVIDEWED